MIDRVTITGADDSINPVDLLPLSKEFPFVEWGILFGSQPKARPRFPGEAWVTKLTDLAEKEDLQLSAHLCGKWVRDFVLKADATWRAHYIGECFSFERLQLNFHGMYHKAAPGFFDLIRTTGVEYILQVDGVNDDMVVKAATQGGTAKVCPLYDASGGAGILPKTWPPPLPDIYCGYAGGLGPENLKDQIELILAITGDARIWIDMETRVRSEDDKTFKLAKVRRCLEIASDYVKKGCDAA